MPRLPPRWITVRAWRRFVSRTRRWVIRPAARSTTQQAASRSATHGRLRCPPPQQAVCSSSPLLLPLTLLALSLLLLLLLLRCLISREDPLWQVRTRMTVVNRCSGSEDPENAFKPTSSRPATSGIIMPGWRHPSSVALDGVGNGIALWMPSAMNSGIDQGRNQNSYGLQQFERCV